MSKTSEQQITRLPYLEANDEFLHPIGDQARWSENYLSHAYDPTAGVGFFLHLIWRGCLSSRGWRLGAFALGWWSVWSAGWVAVRQAVRDARSD